MIANNLGKNNPILMIKLSFCRELKGLFSTSIIIKIELLFAAIFNYKQYCILCKIIIYLIVNISANNKSIFVIVDVLDSPFNYL